MSFGGSARHFMVVLDDPVENIPDDDVIFQKDHVVEAGPVSTAGTVRSGRKQRTQLVMEK